MRKGADGGQKGYEVDVGGIVKGFLLSLKGRLDYVHDLIQHHKSGLTLTRSGLTQDIYIYKDISEHLHTTTHKASNVATRRYTKKNTHKEMSNASIDINKAIEGTRARVWSASVDEGPGASLTQK